MSRDMRAEGVQWVKPRISVLKSSVRRETAVLGGCKYSGSLVWGPTSAADYCIHPDEWTCQTACSVLEPS